jgi:AraC family transcriptional regulator of adaptative response / DNA-3-methyladenine glycosylase II
MEQLLDAQACYAALQARDARFDGHWFTGVTSTGVYCRPICRVRTPQAKNCRFFHHAAAAEAAGFRPCLKCRPELAPRAFSVMEASRSLAHAARERLDAAAREGAPAAMEQLAAQLGITDRHLRRIFMEAFGVAPLAYLQTQRLLCAKQLLTDTALPLAAVALQAGFGSLRAFQDAWLKQYRLPPSQLRAQQSTAKAQRPQLQLGYRPPLALGALLAFLAVRAVPGVERVAERSILRTLRSGAAAGQLLVSFEPERDRALLTLSPALWPQAAAVLAGVRRWLDLDADPEPIALRLADLDPISGLRLPGGLDRFEIAVRAVLGQQVSVAAARTLATRIVERFGERLPEQELLQPGEAWLFPTPQALARAGADAIAACGLPGKRAAALAGLAQHWPGLAIATAQGEPDEAERELQQLAGIGPWTAAYIRMRAWPWPDRFLPGDLVLKQQLAALPKADTAAWTPYRSYAVLQLWARASGLAKESS